MTNSNAFSDNSKKNTDYSLPYSSFTIHDVIFNDGFKNNVAITDAKNNKNYTYENLFSHVNSVAFELMSCFKTSKVKSGETQESELIGILSEKGFNQAVATLAIMKSANAYLPLSLDWPKSRLKSVLQEGNVTTLLVSKLVYENKELVHSLSKDFRLLVIEDLFSLSDSKELSEFDAWPQVNSNDVAYVIFTSGSTGKPKGVTISHKGALNTIFSVNDKYLVSQSDSVLALSELSFDLSVYDLFGPLIVGGKIVFPEQEKVKNSKHWLELIEKYEISIWNTVPQLAKLLEEEYQELKAINNSIRLFLLSGDKIPLTLPTQLILSFKKSTVVSLGGATEGSIWSIWYEISNVSLDWEAIPYGYEMPNQNIYVLNSEDDKSNVGEVGEICIGGLGVAINYWRDIERTVASFKDHPIYGRLYYTGDLGVLNSSGYVEFIGRKDRQLKIRGYRVELGEIESKLELSTDIKECVVTTLDSLSGSACNHSGKKLIAYYVAAQSTKDSSSNIEAENRIKEYLSTQLQDYMVPELYVVIEALPLTSNGKVDYKSLPFPRMTKSQFVEKPKSELEIQIANIWSQVLAIPSENVNMGDEFTQLGGDSIDAIRLSSRLRQMLNCDLSVADIFVNNTLKTLCEKVLTNKSVKLVEIQRELGHLNGSFSLLPIQDWFFEKEFQYPSQWGQLFFIKTPELNIKKLEHCVIKLLRHHDAFSLRFRQNQEGMWNQFYDDEMEITDVFHQRHISDFEIYRKGLSLAQSKFDLENGPLFRIEYLTGFSDGSARVCILAHHLLIDTVSWRILVEDLELLYHGKQLEEKGSSYRQWVSAITEYAHENSEQKDYWFQQLNGYVDPFLSVNNNQVEQAYTTNIKLSKEDTTVLLKNANQLYKTEINDLLLSALTHALSDSFESDNNVIMLEGHGREEIDNSIDISRTMGWFTSLYPVTLSKSEDILSTIKNTKELLRKIPNKGVGYGVLKGYKGQDLPSICFNYLGQLTKNTFAGEDAQKWHLTDENIVLLSPPCNNDGYNLVVTGSVLDGVMCFSIESYISSEFSQSMAINLNNYLNKIIQLTQSQTRTYLTRHDIDNIISTEYLDLLQKDTEVTDIFLANSLQQGFIYHSISQGGTDTAYQVQTYWDYNSEIDASLLENAWQLVQKKYGSLRMRFAWQEQLLQIIDKDATLNWLHLDISDLSSLEQDSYLQELLDEDRSRRFNLAEPGLFRVYLVTMGDTKSRLLLSCHHAIIDGWSSLILINKVHELYFDLYQGKEVNQQENISYQLSQACVQQQNKYDDEYWKDVLAEVPMQSRLSDLIKSDQRDTQDLKSHKYVSKPEIEHHWYRTSSFNKIKKFCSEQGVTINALFEFLCHQIINIYTFEEKTITGATISGRDLPINGVESSVGLLINTLPLVVDHTEIQELSISQAVQQLQEKINYLNSNSSTYLASLQKEGRRVFDFLFVHNNFSSLNEADQFSSLNIENLTTIEKLDYPLAMIVEEHESQLQITLRYAGELFEDDLIKNFFTVMDKILSQLAESPSLLVKELEYAEIESDRTNVEPQSQTIVSIFENNAAIHIDKRALQYGEQSLTYGQVNSKSNQLARYLDEQYSPEIGSMIPICLTDPIQEVISMLAVLKLGCAYVPMAIDSNNKQIAFTLNDVSAPFVICQNSNADKFLQYMQKSNIAVLDNLLNSENLTHFSSQNLALLLDDENLCCVMYTSGSTGTPKGVGMIKAGDNFSGQVYSQGKDAPLISCQWVAQ